MARVAGTKTPAQLFALAFGIVYLAIGVVGFAVTGFDQFASQTFGEKLVLFPVNPLHNIVHVGLGAVWLGASRTHGAAKTVNTALGVVLVVVVILGMVGALKWLAIEGAGSADNYLHLATAALSIYFGSAGATTARPAAA
jgi:hypothetical protein